MIKSVVGSLLECKDKYIVHQTNCVTTGAGGLAQYLFEKFPYADVYATRTKKDCNINSLRDRPGAIIISGNGQDQRYVVNLMGQLYPGGFWDDMPEDSEKMRHKFFHQGLIKLAKVPNLESVAFPAGIGCGIAGGNWEWYLGMINIFAKYIFDEQGAPTTIYCLPSDLSKYESTLTFE